MTYTGITNKSITDYIGIVKIDNTEYLTGSTLFGICKTAANVAIKDVEIEDFSGFTPTHGLTIHVLFYYSNTANSPSLRIGGTTESNAYYTICATRGNAAGATIAESWREGAIVSLTFVDSRYDDDSTTASSSETDLSNSYWLINSSMDTGADPTSTINWGNVTGASDLHAIEDLDNANSAVTGYLKRTGANTWALQTTVPDDISTVPGITTVGASGGAAAYSHIHGNITNDGTIGRTNNWSLENGDGLLVFDSNNSNKIERSSITFDGSTTSKALTQAGTWVEFNNYNHPDGDGYLHVPATSTTNNGKFLKALSTTAGDIGWASLTTNDIPDLSPSISITAGTSSAAPKINVTVNGISGTAKTITTASTSKYGVTKLYNGTDSDSTTLAATANSVHSLATTINGLLATSDALVYKGICNGYSTSANSNIMPAANKGDTYKIASGGYINGEAVEAGDMIICNTDDTVAGDTTNWDIIQTNLVNAVTSDNGDAGYIAKFKSSNIIEKGPKITSNGTDFLREDGNWITINKTFLQLENVTNHAQVTSLQWDKTNKKITYKVSEGTAQNIMTFEAGSNISLTGTDNKLTIANTYSYTLPLAADGTRGGIQIGYSEDNSGSDSSRNYAVQLSSEKAYVNVPWTDTQVTQNILATTVEDTYPLLVSAYKTNEITTTATTVNRVAAIYVKPKNGELHASNFYGDGANITGITTNHISANSGNTGTKYLRQSGWKTLSIDNTSKAYAVTAVSLSGGTAGTATQASVSNGVLTITVGTNTSFQTLNVTDNVTQFLTAATLTESD